MPELPEGETIRRDLEKEVVGKRVRQVEVTGMRSIRRHPNKKHFIGKIEGYETARIGEYDADHAPDAAEWLDLDEAERLFQVEDYHRSIGEEGLEMLSRHATAHVIVEDQIAAEPTSAEGRALSRLIVEGLDRHEAIHAVACVYMAAVSDAVKAGATAETLEVPPPCDAELDRLTVETWRRDYGDGSEDEA